MDVYREGQATERFADEGKTGLTAKKGRPTLRTVDGDQEALQRLLRCRLAKTPLAMVDESTLDAVEVELASRYSSRTIKNTWAVLAKALAQAVKWKRITRNPAQTTNAPEVARNRKVRHYTLEEMLALQRACATSCDPHPVLPAYVAVAFMTGARPEELLALQWPDIDFAAGEFRVTKVLARSQKLGHYVRVGAKTEDSETYVLVPQFALEALKSLYNDYLMLKQTYGLGWNSDLVVFWAPPGCNFGKRWSQDGLYHAISHRAKRARLPWFGAYGFRHGCATYLLEQGEDIHVVKETLRHSTITLTSDTYAARTRKITGRARAAFDRAETGAIIKLPERQVN